MGAMVIDFIKIMLPPTPDEAQVRRFQRIVLAWENGRDRIMRRRASDGRTAPRRWPFPPPTAPLP